MPRRTMTLLGPDVLLVAMGRAHPNNAVLVIELEGALDGPRFERISKNSWTAPKVSPLKLAPVSPPV